jgi:alcohol dehydrogenase class IV
MNSLLNQLPESLLYGEGVVSRAGKLAAGLGKNALIVTGKNSAKASGVLDQVILSLAEAGVNAVVFSNVPANPTSQTVLAGVQTLRTSGCGLVVGLGGGSAIDAAKAIAFAAVNKGALSDYIFGRKTPGAALPMMAIPTTCGTGSEANHFAVITDVDTGDKKSLRCGSIYPAVSLVDPALMKSMPRALLACVGFDAICHLMEAYLLRNACAEIETRALAGLRLAAESLPELYRGTGTNRHWADMTLASTIGGYCIGKAGVTAPHGLEHPVSGLRNVTHGLGLVALTPVITARSIASAPEKYRAIAEAFGGKSERELPALLHEFLENLQLNTCLSAFGVQKADISWLTENTLKVSAASIAAHPRVFIKDEIAEIFLEAL